jgi:hypothetical protein
MHQLARSHGAMNAADSNHSIRVLAKDARAHIHVTCTCTVPEKFTFTCSRIRAYLQVPVAFLVHCPEAYVCLPLRNTQNVQTPYTLTVTTEEIDMACSDVLVLNMKGDGLRKKDW